MGQAKTAWIEEQDRDVRRELTKLRDDAQKKVDFYDRAIGEIMRLDMELYISHDAREFIRKVEKDD